MRVVLPVRTELFPKARLLVQTGFMAIKDLVDPKGQSRFRRRFHCNFTNAAAEELLARII